MHTGYLENQVNSADPIGLVQLLYEAAIDSLRQARTFFELGAVPERSSAISKAMQIVPELQSSLDMERGAEIAAGLAQLYVYVQERLAEANAQRKRAALEEALQLLLILEDGWKQAASGLAAPPPVIAAVADQAGWTL
jgi:flagellar protein FliS